MHFACERRHRIVFACSIYGECASRLKRFRIYMMGIYALGYGKEIPETEAYVGPQTAGGELKKCRKAMESNVV